MKGLAFILVDSRFMIFYLQANLPKLRRANVTTLLQKSQHKMFSEDLFRHIFCIVAPVHISQIEEVYIKII